MKPASMPIHLLETTHHVLRRAGQRFLEPGQTPHVFLDYKRWPKQPKRRNRARPKPDLKAYVLEQDPLCRWCMASPSTTIDYVHPTSRGGSNSIANLVGSCEDCNLTKNNFLPKEIGWRLHLPLRAFELATHPAMALTPQPVPTLQ